MKQRLDRFVEADQAVTYLAGFDHALVHCPRCDRMAVRRDLRVTCGECGYSDARLAKVKPPPPPQRVTCPDCNRFAGSHREDLRTVRLHCRGCGWTREPSVKWPQPAPVRGHRARLWLETDFRGHRLWAVNERHLSFLEAYVAAGVRETDLFNGTLASRLPAWIKSGKHRPALLRALRRLRERLPERPQ